MLYQLKLSYVKKEESSKATIHHNIIITSHALYCILLTVKLKAKNL